MELISLEQLMNAGLCSMINLVTMAIESTWWPWKPSLLNQYRIRIAKELCLAQHNELRQQISLVEKDIHEIVQRIEPIDFAQIYKELNSCISLCQIEQRRTLKEYVRTKKQLIHLTPKLLIGHAYLRVCHKENPLPLQPVNVKKRRKRLKLSLEQQWKKGIADVYRKLQAQRDHQSSIPSNRLSNISIPAEPLPITTDYPIDEPPIIPENIIEHEFLAPLPPPPIDEMIIPFQTPPPPPIACRSPPSDRLQLGIDDTIVKSHRCINKTLGNISRMSFHIDPDQCSSPKSDEKKKKNNAKKLLVPPAPPQFSSTAIFDTHAFFTQTHANKTKKQKKKIDISRAPLILTQNEPIQRKGRKKKSSPYDFQEDDSTTSFQTKGKKILSDDIITARFAKNSHYQSHQSSMASIKSNEHQKKRKKKKKKNLLGIGSSSPMTNSTNLTLSPGRLSTDDDYHPKRQTQRRRVK